MRQLKAEESLLVKRVKENVVITVPEALDNQLANVLVIKGGGQLNEAGVRALVTDLAALVEAKGKPFLTGLAHLGDEILIHDKYYRGEWIDGQFAPYPYSKSSRMFEDARDANAAGLKTLLQKYGLTVGKSETRFVEAASNPDLIYEGKRTIDPVRSGESTAGKSSLAGSGKRAAKAGGDVQSLSRQLRGVYLDAARNAVPSQGAGAAYTADQLAYTKERLTQNLSKKLGPDAKQAITQLAVDAAVMSAPDNAPFLRQQLPAGIAEMLFDSMQAIAAGKKIDSSKLARRGSAEFLPTDHPIIQGAIRAAVPKLAQEGAAMLKRTTRNVEKAEAFLIDDLLLLARLDSGRVELNWQAVPLQAAAQEALDDAALIARARGVSLENAVPADLVAHADPERLRQIFANLIDNAIKYGRGEGRVVVRGRALDATRVEFAVRDDGPGIPADAVTRIFERFYRVDKARSRAQGGTGLGLAIVKNVVQAHGGDVRVESAPGAGTEFFITLPAGPK